MPDERVSKELYKFKNIKDPTCKGRWWRNVDEGGGSDIVTAFRYLDKMLWYEHIGSTNQACREEGVTWTGPIPVPEA